MIPNTKNNLGLCAIQIIHYMIHALKHLLEELVYTILLEAEAKVGVICIENKVQAWTWEVKKRKSLDDNGVKYIC